MKNKKSLFALSLIILLTGVVFSFDQKAYAAINPLEDLANQQLEEMRNQAGAGSYDPSKQQLSEKQIEQLRLLQQFTEGQIGEAYGTNPEAAAGLDNFYQKDVKNMYENIFNEYEAQQAAKKAQQAVDQSADDNADEDNQNEEEKKQEEEKREPEEEQTQVEDQKPASLLVAPTPPPAPSNVKRASPKTNPAKTEEKAKTPKEKVQLIRTDSEKKFNVKIIDNKQDTNADGASDEVEILFGFDPKTALVGDFSNIEKKLYGVRNETDLETKCSIGFQNGTKVASSGFTVLAACPKNKSFTLYLTNKDGLKSELQTKQSSESGKIIFAFDNSFALGEYTLQVRPSGTTAMANLMASVLRAETSASEPVKIKVVEQSKIVQPRVQKIENVDVAGVRDIKINPTLDGKIRVSGVADLGTLVVSTFESAIFTSALIADVDGGYFETVSQKPLASGNHEVTVYASDLDLGIQSKPVKLSFKVLPPLVVDTPEHGRTGKSLDNTSFPYVPVFGALGLAVLIVGIAFVLKKRGQ